MIQVNELRIGNHVIHEQIRKSSALSSFRIDEIRFDSGLGYILRMHIGDPISILDLKIIDAEPIPLMEETLLKCGFFDEEDGEYNIPLEVGFINIKIYHSGGMPFYRFYIYGSECLSYRDTPFVDIKYIHQLQNLYFALTGKELGLKP